MRPELGKTTVITPKAQVTPQQPQVERQTVPLTADMVMTRKIKPGDYVVATQDIFAKPELKIFTAGDYYRVQDYADQDKYRSGLVLAESDYQGRSWIISFNDGGVASTFKVAQYTPEEQQFQQITERYGELPVRLLEVASRYPSGIAFQDLQQVLLQELYRGQDLSKIMPQVTQVFVELRNLGYLTVAKNKRTAITPLGQRYLEFK